MTSFLLIDRTTSRPRKFGRTLLLVPTLLSFAIPLLVRASRPIQSLQMWIERTAPEQVGEADWQTAATVVAALRAGKAATPDLGSFEHYVATHLESLAQQPVRLLAAARMHLLSPTDAAKVLLHRGDVVDSQIATTGFIRQQDRVATELIIRLAAPTLDARQRDQLARRLEATIAPAMSSDLDQTAWCVDMLEQLDRNDLVLQRRELLWSLMLDLGVPPHMGGHDYPWAARKKSRWLVARSS